MEKELFWELVNDIVLSTELEDELIMDILLDENEEIEDLIERPDVLGQLGNLIEPLIGEILLMEMVDMEAVHEEEEIAYGSNERVDDWRLKLPRMDYMRRLEYPTFLCHFRMNRETFESLIVVMGHHLIQCGRLVRLRTEIDKCLLMALWILFNLDTFRSTGVTFRVSRGVVFFHYTVVIEALRELAPKFIKWPSPFEREGMKRSIYEKTRYPGVVGALDGILFKCYAPAVQRERYFDRHHAHSINVQAICDSNLLFRNIYVGEPGSVHDQRAFSKSPIFNLLLEGEDLVGEDDVILADGGYECMNKVLTPFRDLGNMTERQRRFNFNHSSIRMCIERSFGVLRARMRRLLKLDIKRFEYLLDHIVASFVLHNFIMLGGREADGICIPLPQPVGNPEDFDDENEDVIRDGENNAPNNPGEAVGRPNFAHPLLARAKTEGNWKREAIANLLLQPN